MALTQVRAIELPAGQPVIELPEFLGGNFYQQLQAKFPGGVTCSRWVGGGATGDPTFEFLIDDPADPADEPGWITPTDEPWKSTFFRSSLWPNPAIVSGVFPEHVQNHELLPITAVGFRDKPVGSQQLGAWHLRFFAQRNYPSPFDAAHAIAAMIVTAPARTGYWWNPVTRRVELRASGTVDNLLLAGVDPKGHVAVYIYH